MTDIRATGRGGLRSGLPRLAFAAVLTGALAIAFSPIFVRLSEVPPTATAFYRVLLAVPLFAAWAAVDRPGRSAEAVPPTRRSSVWLLLAGLFFAGDLAVWHWSLSYTSVANSTLLANLAPIFVTVAAWLLFGERIRAVFVLGLVVALGGAVVLVGAGVSFGEEHLLGDALAFATALFYAGYLICVKELRRSMGTARLMAGSSLVTALPLLMVTLAAGEDLLPETLSGWLMLFGVAWVSQFLGQGLIAYGLAHLPASFSSVSLLVQPGAAALLAWLILDEELSAWQALGGAAVLAGILLARRGSRL